MHTMIERKIQIVYNLLLIANETLCAVIYRFDTKLYARCRNEVKRKSRLDYNIIKLCIIYPLLILSSILE